MKWAFLYSRTARIWFDPSTLRRWQRSIPHLWRRWRACGTTRASPSAMTDGENISWQTLPNSKDVMLITHLLMQTQDPDHCIRCLLSSPCSFQSRTFCFKIFSVLQSAKFLMWDRFARGCIFYTISTLFQLSLRPQQNSAAGLFTNAARHPPREGSYHRHHRVPIRPRRDQIQVTHHSGNIWTYCGICDVFFTARLCRSASYNLEFKTSFTF